MSWWWLKSCPFYELILKWNLAVYASCHACLGLLEAKFCNNVFLTLKLHFTIFEYIFTSLHLSVNLHVEFVLQERMFTYKPSSISSWILSHFVLSSNCMTSFHANLGLDDYSNCFSYPILSHMWSFHAVHALFACLCSFFPSYQHAHS